MQTIHKILFGLTALSLSACMATPELQVKGQDMSMGIVQEAPVVTDIAVSPDGGHVLTSSYDKRMRLWNISEGKMGRVLSGHDVGYTGDYLSIAITPDGKNILSGGKGVKVWNLDDGNEVMSFGDDRVNSLSVSRDGKYILAGGWGGWPATLWDGSSGDERIKLGGKYKRAYVQSSAISPDGKYVLAGYAKGVTDLVLWDVQNGKPLNAVQGSEKVSFLVKAQVNAVAFSPDGRFALSGGNDGTVRLWTVPGMKAIKTFGKHSLVSSVADVDGVSSIAFSPDGRLAASGGYDQFIAIWDVSTGAETRRFKAHSGTKATEFVSVVFSSDGKRLISGGDASVRVWDVSTGEEIATLISFSDGEWIITTPNGYYTSSEKGDQYLKVKVGGKGYTIEQLRESFYRPDLVKTALAGGSLKEFQKLADVKQPPTVSIVNTPVSVNRDEVSVTLSILDNGGGIGDVRLYNNGSAVMLDSVRGVKITPTGAENAVTKSYPVKLVNGVNALRAIAFNGDNTMQSADAVFQVTANLAVVAKPALHALVVGINEYKNPKLRLNYAVADAALFADTLRSAASGLFEKVNVSMLSTREATSSENIIKELKAMRSLNPDDLFVFYVASHGTVDNGEYYLVTSNVGSTSTLKLKQDAVSQTLFKELVANIPATKKLIVIDTCSAGVLGDAIQTAMMTRGMSEDTAIKVLSRAVGSTILSASTSVQEAVEGYKGHGLFTYVVTEGLRGGADSDKDGFVKTTELANYVDDEVPALAEKVFKRAQYPTVSPSGMGFPVGKVK